MIRFKCNVCGEVLNAPDSMAAKKGRCRKCGSVVTVSPVSVSEQAIQSKVNRPDTGIRLRLQGGRITYLAMAGVFVLLTGLVSGYLLGDRTEVPAQDTGTNPEEELDAASGRASLSEEEAATSRKRVDEMLHENRDLRSKMAEMESRHKQELSSLQAERAEDAKMLAQGLAMLQVVKDHLADGTLVNLTKVPESQAGALRNLKSIDVTISEIPQALAKHGITAALVRTRTELALRREGFRVDFDADSHLVITLSATSPPALEELTVFGVNTMITRPAYLPGAKVRAMGSFATCTQIGVAGELVGRDTFLKGLDACLDNLLNELLTANPKQ